MVRRVALAAAALAVLVGGGLGVRALVGGDPDSLTDAIAPEPIDYVALGDSYSAGPLIPMLREDRPGCFVSTNSYPAYVADLLDVATYRDATCSGATTQDLARRQPTFLGGRGPRPQVAALSAETDVVTMGLGGNDFGLFGSVSGGCGPGSWRAPGAPCRERFTDATGRDTKARDARRIRVRVETAVARVRERAPGAEVYVVGYPRLLPETGSCRAAGFTRQDADWARRIATLLNRSLRLGAEAQDATYVDLYPASRGHDVCAGTDAWVNGRQLRLGRALGFHPFQVGMREAARVVYEAVTGDDAPAVTGNASPPAGSVVQTRGG